VWRDNSISLISAIPIGIGISRRSEAMKKEQMQASTQAVGAVKGVMGVLMIIRLQR
jgi:hypothetical protein